MRRSFFIAAAVSAASISLPLRARSQDLTKRTRAEAGVGESGRRELMRYCESAVVWLNTATGIYYYKGDRWYGHTKRGAYTCEAEAIRAGNHARPDGLFCSTLSAKER